MIFFGLIYLFLSSSIQALELETKDFIFCQQKTAVGIEARTIRIHTFPREKKCAVVYSVKGKDKVVSRGPWMTYCRSQVKEVLSDLQKGLWKCDSYKKLEAFYSFPGNS